MSNLNGNTFSELPIELKEHILYYVGSNYHYILSLVSREWYHIIKGIRKRNKESEKFTTFTKDVVSNISMLKWARENGCPWNTNICSMIAYDGNLDVLKWAHSEGCPLSIGVCNYAALNGKLNILKWAREQNPPCPWDGYTYWYAYEYNNCVESVMTRWIQDNGCPNW